MTQPLLTLTTPEATAPKLFAIVEIENTRTTTQMIPNGINVPVGVNRMRVPEDHVLLIQKFYVESRMDQVKQAQEVAANVLEEALREGLAQCQEHEKADRAAQITAQHTGSVSKSFRDAVRRDMLPFDRCTVIEQGLLPEEDETKTKVDEQLAARMAKAFAAASQPAASVDIDAIVAAAVEKALAAQAAKNQNQNRSNNNQR